MKKLIDIPDDKIKAIKKMAVESDSKSTKEYIEKCVITQLQNDEVLHNLLAKELNEDGQFERFFFNLINGVFQSLIESYHNEMAWFDKFEANDESYMLFLKQIKGVTEHMIISSEDDDWNEDTKQTK